MINWEDIDTHNKTSGQFKVICPACIDTRSNKHDKSLSVSMDKGVANCHYCNEFSIRDIKEREKKEYKLPPQEWQNKTKLSDKLVKWFAGRGISQDTITANKITEEEYYQPAMNAKVNNVVFNYFEGNTVVNKKYRSATKKFTQSSGTKNIFYGINDVIGQKEIYIVEGEMDKLSLWEVGFRNCISVPNGANDNDDVWDNCKDYLDTLEKVYIATDCDTKGNEVGDKIAKRLGRWKCERVKLKNKDANEDLMEGRDILIASLKNREKYPVVGTHSISDFKGAILDLYSNGLPKTLYPKNNGLNRLKNKFELLRGQLVTVTGIPSHGKSTFTEWYILNLLAENDLKASFFSPEHQPFELWQSRFIEQFYGRSFWNSNNGKRITKNEIDDYIEWANQKIYITFPDQTDPASWDWIISTFKDQMYAYGSDIFVIDAFNKVLLNGSGSKKDQIDDALTRLTHFAQSNNVIVFLIAHPTKMRKKEGSDNYEIPGLYDISGSSDFRNQTHSGFVVYRDEDYTRFVNLKTKFSFQGVIGSEEAFKWHPTGRYFHPNDPHHDNPLVKLNEKQTGMFPNEYENGYPPEWD